MATQFEVSDRCIRRDVAVLKTAGFPLQEIIGDRGVKRWKMKPFCEQLQFNYSDMIAVILSRRFLEPLAGTPLWEGHQKIYRKVRGALGDHAVRFCERMQQTIRVSGFGSGDYSKRGQIIDTILQAMEDRRRVLIVYQSMQATESVEQELGPQGLIWHNGSLYLIAWSARREEIRNYKVDRIEDATIGSDLTYAVPDDFSLDEWQKKSNGEIRSMPVSIHLREHDIPRFHVSQKNPHPCKVSHDHLNDSPAFFAKLFELLALPFFHDVVRIIRTLIQIGSGEIQHKRRRHDPDFNNPQLIIRVKQLRNGKSVDICYIQRQQPFVDTPFFDVQPLKTQHFNRRLSVSGEYTTIVAITQLSQQTPTVLISVLICPIPEFLSPVIDDRIIPKRISFCQSRNGTHLCW